MRAPDGASIRVRRLETAGAGPPLAFAHATGFCGSCWDPVIDRVAPFVSSITVWDFRGHGGSSRVPHPVSWWDMGNDVLAACPGSGYVGVGHSMGGAALVMAQLTCPHLFSGLVLVEPILLAGPVLRRPYPLAEVVRKRRRVFDSRERALVNFSRKPPFSRWDRAALQGYVADGIVDDGGVLALACDPSLEAEVYDAASAHGLIDLAGRVEIPVTVVVGSESDTYGVEWAQAITGRFPQGTLVVVEGGNHFIPMEEPGLVASAVLDMVGDSEGRVAAVDHDLDAGHERRGR